MFDDKERIVESVDYKAETKRSDDTDAKIDAVTDSERMMATADTTQLRVIEDDAREKVGEANTDSLLDNTFGDKVRIPLPFYQLNIKMLGLRTLDRWRPPMVNRLCNV